MKLRKSLPAAALALTAAGALSAAPFQSMPLPAANDIGDCAALEGNAQITVTVALNPRNTQQRDQFIKVLYTPGTAYYRQFLSAGEFRRQFGPAPTAVSAVTRELEGQGLKVTQTASALLRVSGTPAQLEHAFDVALHTFEVPAGDGQPAWRYRAPLAPPRLSGTMSGSVRAVLGLDSRAHLVPHLHQPLWQAMPQATAGDAPKTTNPPGRWTVADYAQYYNVTPLYKQGLTGRGQTLAILTFATFAQSDAYRYWSALGLKTKANRITEIPVDGGSGPPGDAAGSDETTLDVEQAGGLAPGADILVYEAPNSDQGFVDVFAAAIESNQADTVSISWGEWEGLDTSNPTIGGAGVTNPVSGERTSLLLALDDLLAQAAVQGQSFIAATGDYGAFDAANALPLAPSADQPLSFSAVLSVDDPASQRYITAVGGTTLPGAQAYAGPSGAPITIDLPKERAWSWSYLQPVCDALGENAQQCGIFPAGSGGGVSLYLPRPFYQSLGGTAASPARQALYQVTPAPPQELYALPAEFQGRNVPDLSTNADPQTGYVIYYTSSTAGFGIYQAGGTSFTGPQLNGVTSLLVQALRQRIGLLNPALYRIAATAHVEHGGHTPYRDISTGDNWYWNAHAGYNQASGIGAPDFASLLDALRDLN
jgi:kumamolisin